MSTRATVVGIIVLLAASFALPLIWPDAGLMRTAAAAGCGGASHQVALTAPDASPRSGTLTTTISFRVTYSDTKGCPPAAVIVVIPGVGQAAMSMLSGSFASGAVYG
ncbi:MAG TPA: hypothetical protein VK194_01980, partial [Candidatus Deferrimicrobium sp.]|nr:hypothetical protein [Candidatus Deferrimicrobium sp.]